MSLLAPWALLGLGLLAIPIVVHLFKPRHVRQTPFSSLRWLHLTQQRMARRIQWHQVLLFLLRAAFLTLLVLALARPIWSLRGPAGGLDRIIVLDHSRSMSRESDGRETPFAAARKAAMQLIRQSLPGDRTAILLTGSKTGVLTSWTTEPALFLPVLESQSATLEETRLDTALEPLRALLAQRRDGVVVEVVFLTDNPANGWKLSAISDFTRQLEQTDNIRWRLLDVSLPAPRNAWIAAANLGRESGAAHLKVELNGVGDGPLNRTLKVTGINGVEPLQVPVTIAPGRPQFLNLPLPPTFVPGESYAEFMLEPVDDLPSDDRLHVDLSNSQAASLLLVTPVPSTAAASQSGLALQTAIQALRETGSLTVDGPLEQRTIASVTADEIAHAAVILLADVPGVSESLAAAISTRVRNGAGLIAFLGPGVDFQSYNQQFRQPLDATGSLLPAELKGSVTVEQPEHQFSQWSHWNNRHPVLTGLVDPEIGDLAGTRSQTWYQFASAVPATDEVLATLADGSPAVVLRRVGSGNVAWINSSGDDRWCDLPRRKSFVPLIDRLLAQVIARGSQRRFTIGETAAVALPAGFADNGPPRILNPLRQEVPYRTKQQGTQPWLELDGLREPGFYRIESADRNLPSIMLVAEPGSGDSRLDTVDMEKFQSWWSPLKFSVEKPQTFERQTLSSSRMLLAPWLIGLALLCFLAELFFVHWLCPRMNPAISVSHHRRRGFVAPLKQREAEREEVGAVS